MSNESVGVFWQFDPGYTPTNPLESNPRHRIRDRKLRFGNYKFEDCLVK